MGELNVLSAQAVDIRAIDFGTYDVGTALYQTSTDSFVDQGNGAVADYTGFAFGGVGFTYDSSGHLASGAITSIAALSHGTNEYYIWNIDVGVTDFANWAHSTDHGLALANLLAGDSIITGGPGNDHLETFSGNDNLYGGVGADTLVGGGGNDHLYGLDEHGGADDGDSLAGGAGSDYLQGNGGNDTLDGGAGSDRLLGGADDDWISGGIGSDSVNGNKGNDTILGGDGNDTLYGGQGDDLITGGNGDDVINGDLGNDTIDGDDGDNVLTGGEGTDVFRFSSQSLSGYTNHADIVTDYVSGTDHLSVPYLRSLQVSDLGETTDSLVEMKFKASVPLQNGSPAPSITVFHEGGDTYVLWASPASYITDHAVILGGEHSITPADFV
jgi:serralysin